jgi:CRP-like cAMP-binding protein
MLSRVEIVLHLRSLALFDRLTTGELSDLATIVREERRPAGETIVREGDFDDSMFLVVTGEVNVIRAGLHVATTGPGDFFGEMAVLDGETRSADVVAHTAVHLLRLERADLFRLMDEQPSIAIGICRTLSRRVRNLLAAGDAPKT